MKWRKRTEGLFLVPSILFLMIFGLGMLMAFMESLMDDGTATMGYYMELFRKERFMRSVLYSVWITAVSTVLSLVIGLLFVRVFKEKLKGGTGRLLVWIPMLFPHFVWAYLVFLLLNQSGFLSNLLGVSGLMAERTDFPVLVQDPGGIGIIVTYVWKEVPFVILMLLPVYASLSKGYREAATLLGANPVRMFTTAEWPFIKPALIETGAILFAFIFTAFEVPQLLGVTSPQMIAVLTYEWFYSGAWTDRPFAFAALLLAGGAVGMSMWLLTHSMNKERLRIASGGRGG
ncbi:ABC transporter permease [Rossellomorea marisflavi]|uniref:ABC transporter permease n=1 Tax=Rossellomorea TaxID=2837508 RepID=UPI00069CF5DA|nr:ABC transporter permease subunit [Rossellomorea marisflavi]USK92478.1 ABC transporter permease subunit [Rossellomorea marisflavi]